MPDNTQLPGTGTGTADIKVATDKVTYSGDADVDVQLVRVVQVTGAEGSKTVVDLPGDATNGLDVDVTRMAGTGTNASGQVTISSTSATVIASRAGRRGVLVINNQTVPVFLDPSGGTAATTHGRLDPGAAIMLPVTSAITGITSAAYTAVGDAKVHYFELY